MKTIPFQPWAHGRIHVIAFFFACVITAALSAAEPTEAIDWTRARELSRRSQKGETLTPAEQSYLNRARSKRLEERARQPGEKIDVPRQGQALPAPRNQTGLVPLNEIKAGEHYKGQTGGLYGQGQNQAPPLHLDAARKESARIAPLDATGQPSASGKVVLLSLGMSNTTMEYSRFQHLAQADPLMSPRVVIVDGAQGGQDAVAWADPAAQAWKVAEARLRSAGVTPAQVQVLWCKQAVKMPARFGEFPAHNTEFSKQLQRTLHLARDRFPNLRIAYLSSRIYAGFAKTPLNPEPYAYENAFAVRDLILKQAAGDPALTYDKAVGDRRAPLLLWGPYLWADGIRARATDGLTWTEEDLSENDGTHPSKSGRDKVARLLLEFLKTDPTAQTWFLARPAN